VKNPAAETAGLQLFECLFFGVIPASPKAFGRPGILSERFRTSLPACGGAKGDQGPE